MFPWEQPNAGELRTVPIAGLRHSGSGGDEVTAIKSGFSEGDAVEMQFGKMVASPYWSTGTVAAGVTSAEGTVAVVFGEQSRWMDRRPPNYFLKQGATGFVAGRQVTWDPEPMTVVDTQSGEVLHDLRTGFAEMDRVIRAALYDSLRKIATQLTLSRGASSP